jgi:hypothetical protein
MVFDAAAWTIRLAARNLAKVAIAGTGFGGIRAFYVGGRRMGNIGRLTAFLLPAFFLLAQSPAHAAAAKATFFACKEQAVFKKAFEHPAGKPGKNLAKDPAAKDLLGKDLADKEAKENRDKRDAYFKAKVVTGECTQLARGEDLSVDERAGNLWCVRPSGGLDCYWTLDQAIDLNPSMSASTGAAQTRSSKHR